MTLWPALAHRHASATLIDLERYASTLDAIDRAIVSTERAVPSGDRISPFGWGDPISAGDRTLKRTPRPIVPARASDPSDLLIGVLQRLVWNERELHASRPHEGPRRFYILLAMADRLSKRKLRLNADQAVDLSRFCIFPGPTETTRFGRTDYMAPIIKQLERAFPETVPKALKRRLAVLGQQIEAYKADTIERGRASGNVPGTKLLDKFRKRVSDLAR